MGRPPRDAEIVAYIQAATPVIEQLHGPVIQTNVTQRRDGGKRAVTITGSVASAAAVTAVRINGTSWDGFVVDPVAGIVYAGPTWAGMTFPPGMVEIDVTVGYATIPQNLRLAARELVRWWVQNGKQSPAAGVLDISNGVDQNLADPFAVPRRVRQLCAPNAGSGFA